MDVRSQPEPIELLTITARVVSSYVGNNSIAATAVPGLIGDVHAALSGNSASKSTTAVEPPKPAVPIKKSVFPDHIICLEDGLTFKSLKRHLGTAHGITPEQYREKWGLPEDYPMVAPDYAAARSHVAKATGLGRKRNIARARSMAAKRARGRQRAQIS